MTKLELLQELNISGNQLKSLPEVLGRLNKLVVLRAHSNYLTCLPDFKKATALRVSRVGFRCPILFRVTDTPTDLMIAMGDFNGTHTCADDDSPLANAGTGRRSQPFDERVGDEPDGVAD